MASNMLMVHGQLSLGVCIALGMSNAAIICRQGLAGPSDAVGAESYAPAS